MKSMVGLDRHGVHMKTWMMVEEGEEEAGIVAAAVEVVAEIEVEVCSFLSFFSLYYKGARACAR